MKIGTLVVVHTHLHVDHVGWDGHFPNAWRLQPVAGGVVAAKNAALSVE